MNNSFRKKAGITACLFFCLSIGLCQELSFDSEQLRSYYHCLHLRFDSARAPLKNRRTPADLYILNLAQTIELLLTEDKSLLRPYEDDFTERLRALGRAGDEVAAFVKAELRLHAAFVQLKFGDELDAALNIRSSHQLVTDYRKRYPKSLCILKTSALLDVMLGSVPQRYQWLLSALGMSGNIGDGLDAMTKLKTSESPLSAEASFLLPVINTFLLQRHDDGAKLICAVRQEIKDSPLICRCSDSGKKLRQRISTSDHR